MDKLTPERRSANMSRIRSQNTTVELALRRALWAEGIRGYRVHPKQIPGKPDLAWKGRKIAVFVDSCFFHQCPEHFVMPASNLDYWRPKLERNRQRDVEVNVLLKSMGWTVVRLWEHQVRKHPEEAVAEVKTALRR